MNRPVELRGSFPGLFGQLLASVVPVAAALCLFLFGTPGWRVFLASAVFTPVVAAIAWAISRLDRLELDDASGALRRPLRKPLAYGDVEILLGVETLGQLQVVARTRRRGNEILLIAYPARERELLAQTLGRRMPRASWRWSRYRSWRLTALLVVLLGGLYGAGAWYFLKKTPAARAICEHVAAGSAADASFRYEHEGLVLTLPEGLAGVKLTVIATGGFASVGPTGRAFLWLAGIQTEHDLFRYAACSRFGFVPLVLRALLLGRWESVRILASDRPPHRALAIRGYREGRGEVRLLLQNLDDGIEAVVAFPEPEGFDGSAFRELVAAARLRAAPGGEKPPNGGTPRPPAPYP